MTTTVFHRRKRLWRRGGNHWYRDRSARKAETVCGAPVTEYDCGWRDKSYDWTIESGRRFTLCTDCKITTKGM